jgi:hypothetical protein
MVLNLLKAATPFDLDFYAGHTHIRTVFGTWLIWVILLKQKHSLEQGSQTQSVTHAT